MPAGLGQVGVQFEEFGTRLNFLPIVLGNGRIYLEVEPEVSNLDPSSGTTIQGTVVPGRSTQRIHTTVELEDGQTYVLGGLIQHNVRANDTKVPIVGEIPFLGAAFSRKLFDESEAELLIMVTPHLVDAMSCDQVPRNLPGHETRSPDDFELFLEGILEAPRGQREVCPGNRYLAAYKNDPTANLFLCGGPAGNGGPGACGVAGCPASDPPGPAASEPIAFPRTAEAPAGAAPEAASTPMTLPALHSGAAGADRQP